MKGKELHFSIDLSKLKHELFCQKEKESNRKKVECSTNSSNKKTASTSRLYQFSSISPSNRSIRSYGSSYYKYYKERSMSLSNFNISVNQTAKKNKSIMTVKKENKIKTDKENTIRKSTLPLNQIYRNASPYSDLFTWNHLFTYRNIKSNISSPVHNNNISKSPNKVVHRNENKSKVQLISKEQVPTHIRPMSEFSEYLINKKNQMIEDILSKKKIDYHKIEKYSSYSSLPFKKKLNYLLEKKCKE